MFGFVALAAVVVATPLLFFLLVLISLIAITRLVGLGIDVGGCLKRCGLIPAPSFGCRGTGRGAIEVLFD